MMARGLDRIVEKPLSERANEQPLLLTRRDLLKMIGFTVLTLAGVGFAGCSSKGSEEDDIEFKSQNPLQSGYRLIYPKNSKPVPDNVIKHIEEIGGERGFEAYPPSRLLCLIKDNGKWEWKSSRKITPTDRIYNFKGDNIPDPCFAADWDSYVSNEKTGMDSVKLQYFEELPKFIDFVNDYESPYSAIIIRGTASDNRAYLFIALIGEGGGKVAAAVFVQNPENPQEYEYYVFQNKEKLDKMMQTIYSRIAKVAVGDLKEIGKYATGDKWRLFPEDMWRKKPEIYMY